LSKKLEVKLAGNYTRMLRAILNVSWQDHITNAELYGNLLPITEVIRDRRLRFIGHCWRNKNEIISDTLLWKPSHGYNSVGRPMKTFVDQIMSDTGLTIEELPTAMTNRNEWKELVKRIRASSIQ